MIKYKLNKLITYRQIFQGNKIQKLCDMWDIIIGTTSY